MIEPTTLDPAPSSPILAAVQWIQGALLGTVATSVAVICVAGLGYQLLTGRIPVRRAVTVILGCFLLFGAPGIVAGLRSLTAPQLPSELTAIEPTALLVPPLEPSRPAPDPFNPYGAE
jgi:type IV secretion system protein VirB2